MALNRILLICLIGAIFSSTALPQAENFESTSLAVVFIYIKDQNGQQKPEGTGFLVAVPSKASQTSYYMILVTARHIADSSWIGCTARGELIARLNKKEYEAGKDAEGVIDMPLSNARWIFPNDDSVDLAYAFIDGKEFEALHTINFGLPLADFPKPSELKKVHVGDQAISAGLLVVAGPNGSLQNFVSERRNYPIFKFGNISSIPGEKVPVAGCDGVQKPRTEWIVAANLMPGTSGSPIVFVPSMNSLAKRWFVVGVQSISHTPSDVAGIAPISFFVDSLKSLNLPQLDLSGLGDDDVPRPVVPTSIPQLPLPAVITPPH